MPKKKQKHFKLVTVVITIVIVGLILLFAWFFSNKTIYTPDKTYIENYVKQIADSVEALPNPVYKDFVDTGCHEGDIGWLGTSYSCSFKAKIFFKDKGDAEANLNKLNEILRLHNFKSKSSAFSGNQTSTYHYEPEKGVIAYMRIFRPDDRSLTAAEELQLNTDIEVARDQYVYGVDLRAVYWSCSKTSWLQGNCPAPPTPAVRL